jgi:hypothetical protein
MSNTNYDPSQVYAGLSPEDWFVLKDIAVAAGYGQPAAEVPEHLRSHPAGKLLHEYASKPRRRLLDQAARALCPLYPDQAWLALEKS